MINSFTAGIYLHIPFCRVKCPYCDFYSITIGDNIIPALVDAAILESIIISDSEFGNFTYDSIYLGGGTPSLLDPLEVDKIIRNLRAKYRIDYDSEITMECNPSSLDKTRIRGYLEAGINRISLGIQSLSDKNLKILGRLHDADEAVKSYRLIKEAGFENVNIDLIYGTPNQTISEWKTDLEKAIELGPQHLSAYNLIIEKGTEFDNLLKQGKIQLPSEDEQSEMYDILISELKKTGYERYEISNFARPGFECRHNLKYWTGKPYLGLGPSAVSFDGQIRRKNRADLTAYIEAIKEGHEIPSETEIIDNGMALEESIMSGLRLATGLSIDSLKERFNYDILHEKQETVEILLAENMITVVDGYIKLTDNALFVSDSVMVKLI